MAILGHGHAATDRLTPRGGACPPLTLLWLLAALLYLTRPDAVLFVAPAPGPRVLADPTACGHSARAALVGMLPAVLWTLFSLVYYGFPFPNTAYAKLGMGIDSGELWRKACST